MQPTNFFALWYGELNVYLQVKWLFSKHPSYLSLQKESRVKSGRSQPCSLQIPVASPEVSSYTAWRLQHGRFNLEDQHIMLNPDTISRLLTGTAISIGRPMHVNIWSGKSEPTTHVYFLIFGGRYKKKRLLGPPLILKWPDKRVESSTETSPSSPSFPWCSWCFTTIKTMQFISLSLLAIAVVGTVAQVSFIATPFQDVQVGVQTEFSWVNADGPVSLTLKFGNLTNISTLASKVFHHGNAGNCW